MRIYCVEREIIGLNFTSDNSKPQTSRGKTMRCDAMIGQIRIREKGLSMKMHDMQVPETNDEVSLDDPKKCP